MTGLNTKTEDLITLLTATNAKLDSIITLLGGAPPTPTATMDDLLSMLTDIHTDTSSMDGKLLTIIDKMIPSAVMAAILDYLSDILTKETSSDTTLTTISGTLTDDIFTTLQSINTDTTSIDNRIYYSLSNMGLSTTELSTDYNSGYLFDSLNWLAKISGATGLPIEAQNRDVIQLLAQIADRPESLIGSGLLPRDLCEDAYISSGMTLVPSVFDAFPSIVYAVFPDPPPSPLSFGTVFGIGIDNTELSITDDDWSGWGIYVASSAANFGLFIGGDADQSLARYPTNVWVDIGFYTYNLSVYVGGSDSIRVYLCSGGWGGGSDSGGPWGGGTSSGGDIPWEDCTEVTSEAMTFTYTIGGTVDTTAGVYGISWADIPGLTAGTQAVWSGGSNVIDLTGSTATVVTSNMMGVTIEWLTGTAASFYIQWVTDEGNFDFHVLSGPSQAYTIASNTQYLLVTTANAFTALVCPPGVSP